LSYILDELVEAPDVEGKDVDVVEDVEDVLLPSKLKVPEKLPVKPSVPQLPPKKEHKTRPNNKIRNRNNASVFIV
jgi:hypothetical protein